MSGTIQRGFWVLAMKPDHIIQLIVFCGAPHIYKHAITIRCKSEADTTKTHLQFHHIKLIELSLVIYKLDIFLEQLIMVHLNVL